MDQAQTAADENLPRPDTERLTEALEQLSVDQIRFVVARRSFPTDKETAEYIGISPNTVKDWKYKGAPIDDAVRLMALDGVVTAQHILARNLAKAALIKAAGLDSDDERVRQAASTEIMDREMGKPTQRNEVSGLEGGPIEIHTFDAALKRAYGNDDAA